MKKTLTTTFLFVISIMLAYSNNLTQNIKGQVLDKASQQPLPGANILIPGSEPAMGAVSDVNGFFKITGVPVGRTSVTISFLGYNTVSLNNLNLASGKELVLNIELEEKVTEYEEVVVKATKPKARPNNEMAVVSARSFTVEETEKYAGSRGDIARMASNYAGVSFANDSRNDIVIRGNTPSGLLWKLEDVEIPNPNHFAENGTTGGPVGMLNNNTLKNSDFFTGAFPAEYGNAMSGVFDLKMRNGNADKYEFTGQCGFNGFEFGAEGPIDSARRSSFMAYYRYSTLDLLYQVGMNFGTSGVPEYQDFTFKVNIPTNKGVFNIFGLAGLSEISMKASKVEEGDMYNVEGQDLENRSSMAVTGISYTHFISPKTSLKVTLSGLYQNGGTDIDTLTKKVTRVDSVFNGAKLVKVNKFYKYTDPVRTIIHDISEYRASISMVMNTKFNSRFSTKAGISLDQMGYKLNTESFIDSLKKLYTVMDGKKTLMDGPDLLRSYYEASYKLTDKLTLNPGLHFIYFTLSKQAFLEPRMGLKWEYSINRSVNIGYGLHSRTHALSTYYEGTFMPDHSVLQTNLNLKATRSHQFVLGHDWNINNELRLKTETYYQYLFDVPIEKKISAYSLINSGAGWGPQAKENLVNKGTAYNYGLELTFEKFLSKNYYFLLTTSLFDSKYKASDDTIRNTVFNGNYVVNALFGYEYPINEKYTLLFDVKSAYAGGQRYIKLDEAASKAKDEAVYMEYEIYENKFDDFFKLDIKFGIKQNAKKYSQEWQIYIENVTNHKNFLYESYDKTNDKLVYSYQLGFFPMMNWRLNF